MLPEHCFCFLAIEQDGFYLSVFIKKSNEIVGCFIFNGGIKTVFPLAALQDIPARNIMRLHGVQTLLVGSVLWDPQWAKRHC